MEEQYTTLGLLLGSVVALAIGMAMALLVSMRRAESKLPPGPRGWPIIGNLGLLSQGIPHQVLAQVSKQYGPLLYLQLGSVPTLVVSSVELAKEALLTKERFFLDRPNITLNRRLWWNKGVLFMNTVDENWREVRRICSADLFSPKRLLSYEKVLAEETSSMLRRVLAHSVNSPSVAMDLGKVVGTMVSNVMGRLLFSTTSFASRDDGMAVSINIQNVIHQVATLVATPVVGDFIPSLGWIFDTKVKSHMGHVHKLLDGLFQGLIEERRPNRQSEPSDAPCAPKQNTPKDFLDVLLKAKESGQFKNYDSESGVKATSLDMLAGGVDTSSIFLEWVMAELVRNPSKLEKLQAEVEATIGHERMVTFGDMPNLPYLRAVIKEAFRLHPPLPLLIPHQSNESCEFHGYVVPPKTRVMVNVWAIGRDPSVWESPLEFLPERFIDNNIDFHGRHFELLPFGAGRRSCPGVSLATKIVDLALSNLVHAFNWSLPDGISTQEIDMAEKHGATVCKLHPLLLVPKPRNIITFLDRKM